MWDSGLVTQCREQASTAQQPHIVDTTVVFADHILNRGWAAWLQSGSDYLFFDLGTKKATKIPETNKIWLKRLGPGFCASATT